MEKPSPHAAATYLPTKTPLSDALWSYIVALAAQGTTTLTLRTGAGRIFRDLLLHWPVIEDREEEAQALCRRITRATFPLAKALFAQAVEISATISPTPIAAPIHTETMTTMVVFDTQGHWERHCYLSKDQPAPPTDMLLTPKGIVLLCRPLNYLYHTVSDDRKRVLFPRVGMYELVERQVNALYDLPDYYLRKPSLDSIKTKMSELSGGGAPHTVFPTALETQALEDIILVSITDRSVPPTLRAQLRQATQNLRLRYMRAPDEETPPTDDAPLVPPPKPTNPVPAPQQLALSADWPPPPANAPAGPAQSPNQTTTMSAPAAPSFVGPAAMDRADIEKQAMLDALAGGLPNIALYNAGDLYYRQAYDAYAFERQALSDTHTQTPQFSLDLADSARPEPRLVSAPPAAVYPASTSVPAAPKAVIEIEPALNLTRDQPLPDAPSPAQEQPSPLSPSLPSLPPSPTSPPSPPIADDRGPYMSVEQQLPEEALQSADFREQGMHGADMPQSNQTDTPHQSDFEPPQRRNNFASQWPDMTGNGTAAHTVFLSRKNGAAFPPSPSPRPLLWVGAPFAFLAGPVANKRAMSKKHIARLTPRFVPATLPLLPHRPFHGTPTQLATAEKEHLM